MRESWILLLEPIKELVGWSCCLLSKFLLCSLDMTFDNMSSTWKPKNGTTNTLFYQCSYTLILTNVARSCVENSGDDVCSDFPTVKGLLKSIRLSPSRRARNLTNRNKFRRWTYNNGNSVFFYSPFSLENFGIPVNSSKLWWDVVLSHFFSSLFDYLPSMVICRTS